MSEDSTASTPRNLFALVVGINAYEAVTPLKGCVGDAEAMIDYLREPVVADRFRLHLKTLFDAEATKSNIVQAFREHLGKASSGDAALFFFAGHGSRERTTVPAFQHSEIDGHIGNLVCVESNIPNPMDPNAVHKPCLADKELRYLIHQIASRGAEMLTIFDCCHSGGNTRNLEAERDLPAGVRQVTRHALKARNWDGFIFHEEIRETDLDNSVELSRILPEGRHIQMAACRDVELAWEFKGRGAFTYALLDTLRSHNGRIRYHDLHSRVRNRMKVKGRQSQSPQIYVQTGNPSDRYQLFLTHDHVDDQPAVASAIFNEDMNHWRIDLGALHGIPPGRPPATFAISVFPKDDPEVTTAARPSTVFAGYSVIEPDTPLDPAVVYRARISGLAIRPLAIHLAGEPDGVQLAREGLTGLLADAELPLLALVEAEEDADYVLRADRGAFLTTHPGSSKPIVQGISYRDSDGGLLASKVRTAYADLCQMARWTFLRDLEYRPAFPAPAPPDKEASAGRFPVELKVIQCVFDEEGNEVEREHDHRRGTVSIGMTHDFDSGGPCTAHTSKPRALLRMELTNHSDRELYCSLFYLSQEFGVSCPFFEEEEFVLDPGRTTKSRKIRGGDYLPFRVPGYVEQDNWEGLHEHLKLVVSEEPFGAQTLKMVGLPEPGSTEQSTRGALDDEEPPANPLPSYWSTYSVELFTVNPFFTPEVEGA